MPTSIAAETRDLVRQVLNAQQETNKQLALINGRTRHLEEREEAHSAHLGNLDRQVVELRERVAIAGVKDVVQDKELDWTRSKLWAVALEVAKIGAGAATGGGIVAIVMKALGK